MKKESKIIPINNIKESERCALIPGYHNNKAVRRLKELKKKRGNCYFTSGISRALIDFIYRSVVKLGLGSETLIFSKGAVKIKNRSIWTQVGVCELDWGVGTSFIIPQQLNYNNRMRLLVNNKEYKLRVMEIIVLGALLRIAIPKKNKAWYSSMAASIIAQGWEQLNCSKPAEVLRIPASS